MPCDLGFVLKARIWPKIKALIIVGQGKMGQVLLLARVGHAIGVNLAMQL